MDIKQLSAIVVLLGLLAASGCATQTSEPAASPTDMGQGSQERSGEPAPPAEPGELSVPGNVPTALTPALPDLGSAPEIHNEIWLNSDQPLTLAAQQGKVVLLEFWTFGCINCQRVIPYVRAWYQAYSDEPLQVISVHYPEFAYEREVANVAEAIERYEIDYPVAIDNDGLTWRAYRQRYWPVTYLIDKSGRIRYKHIGEFSERSAADLEQAIELLLAEPRPGA